MVPGTGGAHDVDQYGRCRRAVSTRARRLADRVSRRFVSPVIERIESLERSSNDRLEAISSRLAAIEVALEALEGRAATAAERSVGREETQARLERRLAEIEELLAEPPRNGE